MTFVDAVKTCFSKYADFSGRATRSEYWWFNLAYILAYIVLGILAANVSGFLILPILGFLIPLLAAAVRRMHDVDKSGWFILIPFYSLYLAVIPGTPGDNRFGPAPAN